MAKLLIQTVLALALEQSQQGDQVTLNLKIGKLMIQDGELNFKTLTLGNR